MTKAQLIAENKKLKRELENQTKRADDAIRIQDIYAKALTECAQR